MKTRVVLLDACRTGGALASKGGHQAPPFDVRLLRPATVAGAAIIAASTASELAQESSRLEGSFFTHHLVSGLRGAADGNGDGRVTLAESYAYAYAQTLSSTSTTLSVPSIRRINIELAGAGELVLTELGRAQATLSLPLRSAGDLFIVFDGATTWWRRSLAAPPRPGRPGAAGRHLSRRPPARRARREGMGLVVHGGQVAFDEATLREHPADWPWPRGSAAAATPSYLDTGLAYAPTGAFPWRWSGDSPTTTPYLAGGCSGASPPVAANRRSPVSVTRRPSRPLCSDASRWRRQRWRWASAWAWRGSFRIDGVSGCPIRASPIIWKGCASAHAVLAFDVALGNRVDLRLGWRGVTLLLRANDAFAFDPAASAPSVSVPTSSPAFLFRPATVFTT